MLNGTKMIKGSLLCEKKTRPENYQPGVSPTFDMNI